MGEKYRFTGRTRKMFGVTVHEIEALHDVGTDVKAGERGGFVEGQDNLAHDGDAWIYPGAVVAENAVVHGNAKVRAGCVFNEAEVRDFAEVVADRKGCEPMVYGRARIAMLGVVRDNGQVYGSAAVYGEVRDSAEVGADSLIEAGRTVSGREWVHDRVETPGIPSVDLSLDAPDEGGVPGAAPA